MFGTNPLFPDDLSSSDSFPHKTSKNHFHWFLCTKWQRQMMSAEDATPVWRDIWEKNHFCGLQGELKIWPKRSRYFAANIAVQGGRGDIHGRCPVHPWGGVHPWGNTSVCVGGGEHPWGSLKLAKFWSSLNNGLLKHYFAPFLKALFESLTQFRL